MPGRIVTASAIAALAGVVAAAPAAAARDRIRIVGSSTVFPFSAVVAENFAKRTPFRAPVVESTGTGGGFKLFCAGVGPRHPDITNASRRIKASEVERCAGAGVDEITEVKIGYDGIVVASAKASPEVNFTKRDLWLALAKDVPADGALRPNPYRTWDQIDPRLPKAAIEVYGPPPTSGTRDAFVELVMEEGCKDVAGTEQAGLAGETCHTIREDGVYVEAGENDTLIVQKLVASPRAYGIFGYSFLDQNQDRIRGAKIAGAAPSFANIAAGEYDVSRPLFFYVKNVHAGVIPGIREFVAEFTSPRAWGEDGYLSGKGLIPLPEEEREEVAERAAKLRPLGS